MGSYKPTSAPTGGTATMAGRMVVARFVDGTMIKGTTQDFLPNRPVFHIYEGGDESATAVAVKIQSLKAVFFVKSFQGNKSRCEDYSFAKTKGYGRKCLIRFPDGEVIAGYTPGFTPDRPGFFIVPAEADSNNERIFVVNENVGSLTWV